MPLTVTRRKSTGALTISGSVAGQRLRRRAQSDNPKLAAEEAAALEAEILRTAWHGERRGSRSFGQAVLSYIEAAPRSENTKALLNRILVALGDVPLSTVDQDAVSRLKGKMLRPGTKDATVWRNIVTPVNAVLKHAAKRKWCDWPTLEQIPTSAQHTRYLLPGQAERLIAAAAPHLKPLLAFLIGTGARLSEALELDWHEVDLLAGRAIFLRTKNRRRGQVQRRIAKLPVRVVAALANLPGEPKVGPVFLTDNGRPYADRERRCGGQIKTAWRGALRRAGLDPALRVHDCRHTWASWHYALHRDLLALKIEGGWATTEMVERYAHLLPAGHDEEIQRFLGHQAGTDADFQRISA
jgi:integrase